MQCTFIHYNVHLVLTQDSFGFPFAPHPNQIRNWSNRSEIEHVVSCCVISVLLPQFLFYFFISLLVNKLLFCFFNFFCGMSITIPMSLENNLIANKNSWTFCITQFETILVEITPHRSLWLDFLAKMDNSQWDFSPRLVAGTSSRDRSPRVCWP